MRGRGNVVKRRGCWRMGWVGRRMWMWGVGRWGRMFCVLLGFRMGVRSCRGILIGWRKWEIVWRWWWGRIWVGGMIDG